ncbi:MAG: glycosyl transferase, family 2, partial [Bryobacterales bacterium]|nr:glycosyl transferase, family 2 [Bryobacterales bacterium]
HIIAGQATDLAGPNIEVEAFVPDVRPAYERAGMVLAPLVASAGTNIKVLEAMAMERVVVGTPAGFNGLPLHPGIDCLLAHTGPEMAAAIRGGAQRTMELAARATAETFDWTVMGRLQQELYSDLSST